MQLKEYPEDHVFVAWRKREPQPHTGPRHTSSPAQPKDSGLHDDSAMRIERERKPYTATPSIRRTSSPPRRFSRGSSDSGFHDTPDHLNKYDPPPPPLRPPPGPPPIDIRAGDRRATDRCGRRGTEGERFVSDINSPRDAEKWDQNQESRDIEPDRFDRPYERGSISIEPRDLRGAPPDERPPERGRAADYDGSYRSYML